MADEHNMRRVTAIKNGTVIDHIPSGQALKVLGIAQSLWRYIRSCFPSDECPIQEDGIERHHQGRRP